MADTDKTSETAPAEGAGEIVLWLDDKRYAVPADPQKIPIRHLNAIEVNVGLTAGQFTEKIMDPTVSTLAWTALAWTAKRMAGEFVKWDDFQDDLSTDAVTKMFEQLAGDLREQLGEQSQQ